MCPDGCSADKVSRQEPPTKHQASRGYKDGCNRKHRLGEKLIVTLHLAPLQYILPRGYEQLGRKPIQRVSMLALFNGVFVDLGKRMSLGGKMTQIHILK